MSEYEIKVQVKYRGEVFKNVEFNPKAPFRLIQELIFRLTQVLPEEQKLLYKGHILKADNVVDIKFKKNCTFLLMGNSISEMDEQKNEEKDRHRPMFIEDLTPEVQEAKIVDFINNKDDMDPGYRESMRQFINELPGFSDVKYYDFTKEEFQIEFKEDCQANNLEALYILRRAERLVQSIKNNDPIQAKKLAFGHYHPHCSAFALAMCGRWLENPILEAIKVKNLPLLKFFVENGKLKFLGATLFMRMYKQNTSPLHIAALQNHMGILKYVNGISGSVSYNILDSTNRTPLMNCIIANDEDGFLELYRPELGFAITLNYIELIIIELTSVKLLALLIESVIKKLHYKEVMGLFTLAVRHKKVEYVIFFAKEMYMDVNFQTSSGKSALFDAAVINDKEMVKVLLSLGALRHEIYEKDDVINDGMMQYIESTKGECPKLLHLCIQNLQKYKPDQLARFRFMNQSTRYSMLVVNSSVQDEINEEKILTLAGFKS